MGIGAGIGAYRHATINYQQRLNLDLTYSQARRVVAENKWHDTLAQLKKLKALQSQLEQEKEAAVTTSVASSTKRMAKLMVASSVHQVGILTWDSLAGPSWHDIGDGWRLRDLRWVVKSPTKDEGGSSELVATFKNVRGILSSNYRFVIMTYDDQMNILDPVEFDVHNGETSLIRSGDKTSAYHEIHPAYVHFDIAPTSIVRLTR